MFKLEVSKSNIMNTIIKLIITTAVWLIYCPMFSVEYTLLLSLQRLFCHCIRSFEFICKTYLHIFIFFPITLFNFRIICFGLLMRSLYLLADHFIDGIQIDGFWWALIFSVALSIILLF